MNQFQVGSGFGQLINGKPLDLSQLTAELAGNAGMRYTAGGTIRNAAALAAGNDFSGKFLEL